MRSLRSWLLCGTLFLAASALVADEGKTVKHEVYNGYFVSNKFEPDVTESFVVATDQKQFDAVFGSAFVMRDKSQRLPKDAFATLTVVAVIKRGKATVEYKVTEVVEREGALEIRYSATATPQPTATFASPLIVGVPKRDYKSVTFVEDKKVVKTLKLTP